MWNNKSTIAKYGEELSFEWSYYQIPSTDSNQLVQHNKQHHRKVLLSSFHLRVHTIGCHSQPQKLGPACTA